MSIIISIKKQIGARLAGKLVVHTNPPSKENLEVSSQIFSQKVKCSPKTEWNVHRIFARVDMQYTNRMYTFDEVIHYKINNFQQILITHSTRCSRLIIHSEI